MQPMINQDYISALVGAGFFDKAMQENQPTKLAYYARPISIDGTKQQERDVALIYSLGFCPYPIAEEKEKALAEYRKIGMDAFKPYVKDSAVLIFRAFPDGSIGAGVAKEIAWAVEFGVPVIEIPRQVERRTLSVDDTREMLKELGQR